MTAAGKPTVVRATTLHHIHQDRFDQRRTGYAVTGVER